MSDDRLRELLAINRAIAGSLDYEEVLLKVVECCARLLDSEACVIVLKDEDGRARVAAHLGVAEERAAAFSAFFDERIHGALRRLLDAGDDVLAVPVIQKGEVAGLLASKPRAGEGGSRPSPPDPQEHFLIGALADQAAIALDHASRHHQLLEESREARDQLEREARRKDEYLAMLAHELRNPLSAITNALALVQATLREDDPRIAQVSAAANRQARLMSRLLDDLLDVSRVTRGKISLDLASVSLQDVLRQALSSTVASGGEGGHPLSLDLPERPIEVLGDADRLVQVFANVLSNAARFSAEGGPIEVSLARDPERGVAVVRVRDEGIGIAPEALSSIFELFYQAEHGPQDRETGLGIGLTLVKSLVEMHGGTVEAKSEGRGTGTEVTVTLPLLSGADTPAETSGSEGEGAPTPVGRSILLVEDDRDVAETMAAYLQHAGHRVAVAHDGPAALEEVARRMPQVVLLDIGLVGMDGFELAREIRRRCPDRRPTLVAVTGYGSERDRARAREAGCDHHLVKPVEIDDLERLLAEPL